MRRWLVEHHLLIFLGLPLGTLLGWWYAFRLAPCWLRVVRLRVGIPALASAWNGLRVAHLSDFHAGAPGVSLELLASAKQAALAFRPDVIALTGDFYDDGKSIHTGGLWSGWPEDAAVLAVLGNHDYRAGRDALAGLVAELVASGVRVLRNEAQSLTLRGTTAWAVGVEDPFTYRADEQAAFDQLPAGAEALLYLAHAPSVVTTMPVGRAKIVLSGHTHGGQLRLLPSGRTPFVSVLRKLLGAGPRREPPVYRGFHRINGAVVLISDGLGLSLAPARFRTRPQVLLIELVVAPGAGLPCDDTWRYVEELNPEPLLWRWLS